MHKRSSSRATTTKNTQGDRPPSSSSSSSYDVTNEHSIPGTKLYALISDVTGQLNAALEENKGKAKENDLMVRIRSCAETLQCSPALVPLLGLVSSDVAGADIRRIAGKLDRALERLRRVLSAWLDRFSTSEEQGVLAVKQLLSVITSALESTIREVLVFKVSPQVSASLADLTTRMLDSIFTLAKYTLILNQPQTHILTCECLSRGTAIIVAVNTSGIPLSNYLRCLSGAYYNFAGSLYQAGSHASVVPFLKEACTIGGKALTRRSKEKSGGEEKAREQEGWKQLEETLYRRWELLGICHVKVGDRKNGYISFLQSLVSFPYSLHNLAKESSKAPPASIFSSTSANAQYKQLAIIIDRITYIGLNELLIPAEQLSFQHSLAKCTSSDLLADPAILGILIEQQVESLEQRGSKDSTQRAIKALLESALNVYGEKAKMRVRRARVLLRLLEVLYRGNDVPSFDSIRALTEEVETLLCVESLGADSELSLYRAQYRALGHLWLALHAHRAALPNQVSLVADHTEKACRILRSVFGKVSADSPRVVPKKSLTPQKPPVRATARRRVPGATTATTTTTTTTTTKARVASTTTTTTTARKATSTSRRKEPVTPALRRAALQPVSLNTVTPPRTKSEAAKGPLAFDDFNRFSCVLQTTAGVLGLLSLSLPKVQLLDVFRKLAEAHGGPTSEAYISSTLDLAHEYMRIGKTRRGISLFNQALESVRGGHVSDDTSATFLLRFAESLALIENTPRSISVYCEAITVAQRIEYDEKNGTTAQRIQARTRRLEKAALAAHTVAMIQHSKGDLTMSIELLLQSLRLWNRAMDNLTRLNPPPPKPTPDDNPFDMSALNEALPSEAAPLPDPTPQTIVPPQRHLDSLGLRISEGLLTVLFNLAQTYLIRGSAKESEFFIKQALDLAQALNAPAILSRALAKQGEIQVRLGDLKAGYEMLVKAGDVLSGVPTIDSIEVVRLTADCRERMGTEGEVDAQVLYRKSVELLREIDAAFEKHEGAAFGPRKSLGLSPAAGKNAKDVVVPDILTSALRQQIWLLRDQNDAQFNVLLEQFVSLPRLSLSKAQEDSLLAKLNLHNVYLRFQSDMFLNSLAESPIAIPMGMHTNQRIGSGSAQDIVNTLDEAEEHFWSSLSVLAQRGNVLDIRESAIALAVIKSFQTSMGKKDEKIHVMMSRLLDASVALTLRREMLEAIHHKFPRSPGLDDIQWPFITPEGNVVASSFSQSNIAARKFANIPVDPEDGEDEEMFDPENASPLKAYWDSVRTRYRSYTLSSSTLSSSQTERLPRSWTVIHISVTEDRNTLFVSRQEGGPDGDSLVFSVPLKGRRDNGTGEDEEEWLTLDGAIQELREIVRLSDEGTKAAVYVKPDDEEARIAWWKQRGELDSRLKNLLENIEFCWFGAFKTILNPKCKSSPESIEELRTQFEKLFKQSFGIQGKRKAGSQRKTPPQYQQQSFSQIKLDDALLRCFSTLSPKCRDEELEDLIYFILDLYQFHGVPIPISEVDITQMIVDLRTIFEEHVSRIRGLKRNHASQTVASPLDDEHVFLILDKNLQGVPWESVPALRGRSVSRVPSMDFLIDRLEYVEMRRSQMAPNHGPLGAVVDPRKGYFILNPSGDLRRTQERFKDWADGMKKAGWDGVIGKPVSEQQFESALCHSDLVVYFGHGGGEQYLRSYKVRRLQTCASTMLWGCSSGALREMGDFDRTGTANAYMLGGCPTLVANLWDVTDRDIDKFSQTVFDKLDLNPENVRTWSSTNTKSTSLTSAVAQARSACKLKYLTGAAPVVYGIPFYI